MTNGIPDPQFDPKQDDMRTTAYSNTGTDYSEYHYQPMRPAPKKRRGPVVLVSLLFAAGFFTAGLLYSMLVSQQISISQKRAELEELEQQLKEQQVVNDELRYDLDAENTDSDEYAEKVARRELDYIKPGERVFYNVGGNN